jgi:hypothetical protein
MHSSPPKVVPAHWRLPLALVLTVLGLPFLGTCALAWDSFATRHDRAAQRLLESADPDARRLGASLAAREEAPHALHAIGHTLTQHTEFDPAVRESCVYALGRRGESGDFDVVAQVTRDDADPYVRHAAWIAAARLDPERFRALASQAPDGGEAWDRIGLACGRLEIGDMTGMDELLRWAAEGDPHQQRVASLALYRGVAPLLEAVGRWPLQFPVREGQPWPAELVAEVRRRCSGLDLRAIAADTRPHVIRAAAVRRDVGRLNATRGRLARFLLTH